MTVIIGIDPHKTTRMAVAIDGDEQAIGRLEVAADRAQTQRLLAWGRSYGNATASQAVSHPVERLALLNDARPAQTAPDRRRLDLPGSGQAGCG
jgi:hypothetical protein